MRAPLSNTDRRLRATRPDDLNPRPPSSEVALLLPPFDRPPKRKAVRRTALGLTLLCLLTFSAALMRCSNTATAALSALPLLASSTLAWPVPSWSWPGSGSSKSLTPRDVQGGGFLSPFAGQAVEGVEGVVTAVADTGFYVQSAQPDSDDRTSEAVFVFTGSSSSKPTVGDAVSVSGSVEEYSTDSDSLRLTEITRANVTMRSSGNALPKPIILGRDRSPPTERIAVEDPFAIPGNTTDIESSRKLLEPWKYGADFWESLEGMLVTIPSPRAVSRTNSYGEVWVVAAGAESGTNARGGITLAWNDQRPWWKFWESQWDVNPEAIWIWPTLDGVRHSKDIVMGDSLKEITGVVSYNYGFPVIYPTAPLERTSSPRDPTPPPTSLVSSGTCSAVSVGSYNVENISARNKARITRIGAQIVNLLKQPDLLGLQEIQDDDGDTDSGKVSSAETLKLIADAVVAAGGAQYEPLVIDPVDKEDGGAPGGNIRVAFLYRPDRLILDPSNSTVGDATTAQTVSRDPTTGGALLALQPGRIDPLNPAWTDSRKPLTASFRVASDPTGPRITAIVAHFASKGGSSGPYDRFQPPVNGGVQQRVEQARVVSEFVKQVQAVEPDARIVMVGDLNEFSGVQPLQTLSETLTEVLPADRAERYSYVYDQNSQQIDHVFASGRLVKGAKIEIVHANNWGRDIAAEAQSDHDPVVSLFDLC